MRIRAWLEAMATGMLHPQGRLRRKQRRLRNAVGFANDYLRALGQLDSAGATEVVRLSPYLLDRTPTTPFDPHYFQQDVWAFRRLLQDQPKRHVDVGSRVIAVGFFSCVVPVEFVDIRPLSVSLPGLTCREGSILEMPYEEQSLGSLSCLHVAEHIGLGRYGDPLDVANGTRNACRELQRVLRPGGQLYFSLPVAGENRVEFNGQRVHTAERIVSYFPELTLSELSVVTDDNTLVENADVSLLNRQTAACGLFVFTRSHET